MMILMDNGHIFIIHTILFQNKQLELFNLDKNNHNKLLIMYYIQNLNT